MGRLISNFFVNWLSKERPPSKYPICDFERIRYEVRPCDVLLIEGRSRVSDVIKLITQSSWSHACLYIGRLHDIEDPDVREMAKQHTGCKPDTQLVLEGMLGKGTIISPLHTYQQDHIRICRPRGLNPSDAQKVIAFAASQLGTDYDVRQIFDLFRLLFPWTIMPRKFRSRLFEHNAGTPTHTVCSTIIAEAFAEIEFPILPFMQKHDTKGIELIRRNPRLYTPRDFDYSPYFEIIKYPFIDFSTHAAYRELPWNREGLVSHDEEGISQIPKEETKAPTPIAETVAKEEETAPQPHTVNEKQAAPLSSIPIEELTQEDSIPVSEQLEEVLAPNAEETSPMDEQNDHQEGTTDVVKKQKTPFLSKLKAKSKKKKINSL